LNRRGFTLIEVVIGLLILAVGLLGIAGMQITSIKGNSFSANMTQASILAQDRLEELRGLPNTNPALNIGSYNDGILPNTIFSRTYTIIQHPTNPSMRVLTVTVRWRDSTDHTLSFSTNRFF